MEKISEAMLQATARVLNCCTFWPDQMFDPAMPRRISRWFWTMLWGVLLEVVGVWGVRGTYVNIITQLRTAPTTQPMIWMRKVWRGER